MASRSGISLNGPPDVGAGEFTRGFWSSWDAEVESGDGHTLESSTLAGDLMVRVTDVVVQSAGRSGAVVVLTAGGDRTVVLTAGIEVVV